MAVESIHNVIDVFHARRWRCSCLPNNALEPLRRLELQRADTGSAFLAKMIQHNVADNLSLAVAVDAGPYRNFAGAQDKRITYLPPRQADTSLTLLSHCELALHFILEI